MTDRTEEEIAVLDTWSKTPFGYPDISWDVRDAQAHNNCIYNIPQDIKLELVNNVLILKAGSILTQVNGTQEVLRYDKTISWGGSTTSMVMIRTDTQGITSFAVNKVVSGPTDSLAGITYHAWFDTINNLINCYVTDGNIPEYTTYLPIAIITYGTTGVRSLDQVFNGFGYMGSTVFALPGVQGAIPNGREEISGTPIVENTVLNTVTTNTLTSGTYNLTYFINRNGGVGRQRSDLITYNKEENKMYESGTQVFAVPFAYATLTEGKITAFNPIQF